ncbi:DMT family transporter [Janibacter alittae]|uniref:SMR family transporter n=1 Tax=Janibacter alittae TaxID=3115209 RepID=A0ABZ2MJ13_9MICO
MSAWLYLTVAVIAEVGGTLSLRLAATGQRIWYLAVTTGYVIAFTGLATALDRGMPLGVAYGIWAAAGVALTAIGSRVFFGEPLTRVMALGITLIMVGVLLVEVGAAH